jgi:lysyl-tRNA synthetase class 1
MNVNETLDGAEAPESQAVHWADHVADKIIKTKTKPDGSPKDQYTCASGITPSGTVHIGNFREIISVDLIVRALREKGKKVRFIYSWDEYDVFRKVPKNMPRQDMLVKHLRWPIVLVPDPWGEEESYARHHEVAVEKKLPEVGVHPEYLYQATRYRASEYAKNIRHALENKERIKAILDEFRTEDLEGDWWPISIFSPKTNKDTVTVTGWDGEWTVSYQDDETGETGSLDLRTASEVKLPWRIDWPMRWSVEQVDFEPAGKDHHSEGGSWSTAEHICKQIYGIDAPITFQYDFIRIKGRGGKISSSSGEVIDLDQVLEIYTPELCRFLFAGTRPNTEFAISFDLDVIKIYEDYDKTERIYYGKEAVEASHEATAAKLLQKEKRIYELSQVQEMPAGVLPFMPLQIPFRTMCNLLAANVGNIDAAIAAFPGHAEAKARGELDGSSPAGAANLARARQRAACAWRWITGTDAPEDMRFSLRQPSDAPVAVSGLERAALAGLRELLKGGLARYPEDKDLQDAIFAMTKAVGIEQKAFFGVIYRVLLGKQQGPRLAGFIRALGEAHLQAMLAGY